MRSKLGTALDIFIILIGPFIIYARIVELIQNGISLYPLISVIIVGLALAFAVYNLVQLLKERQNSTSRKK